MNIPDTSITLVERIQKHDQAAWEQLVRIYGPFVYSWCVKANLQPADCEDLTQLVFTRVYQKIDQFDANCPDRTFRGWLWRVYTSRLADHFRQLKRDPIEAYGIAFEDVPDDPLDPSSPVYSKDDYRALVYRALKTIEQDFEPKTWEAFWRTMIANERASQVAASLGMSSGAVHMARRRVYQRLRETLGGWKNTDLG